MSINTFKSLIKDKATQFLDSEFEQVVLLHHNDCDGLTSAAILASAFERQAITCRRYCLEKPYPQVLERIFNDKSLSHSKLAFVIADFASGILPLISQLNTNGQSVYVLDHHQLSVCDSDKIIVLNGLQLGLLGLDFSSSAVSYEFAEALNPWNQDLAWLGVLGALGDGLLRDGKLVGLNSEIWQEVEEQGRGKFKDSSYCLDGFESSFLIDQLDSAGSIAYLSGGPDVAVKALREGLGPAFFTLAKAYVEKRDKAFAELLDSIELKTCGDIQWFDLKDSISNFGVKTVGLFCQYLIDKGRVEQDKYLAGFQHIPNEIPGLGPIEFGQTKISMRVPGELARKVNQEISLPLTKILPKAARQLGGFVDACHPLAAAATVKIGEEQDLVESMS